MNRINLFRNIRTAPYSSDCVAWGKSNLVTRTRNQQKLEAAGSAAIFAAVLIVCSFAVGCSRDQNKPISAATEIPAAQPVAPIAVASAPIPATPIQQAAAKPVHRKVVRKAPPTLEYTDKNSGVSFEYPRKYALKTGDAANELVSSSPMPMDFVQPGGIAVAAVALPGSSYPNSDLASAFFNVSVNKTLTADQCGEFSVPQTNPATPEDPTVQATAQLADPSIAKLPIGKLMIGDMELQSSESGVGGTTMAGHQEEASKYYHVFQNGACYEFALKVATSGDTKETVSAETTKESNVKPVNRDEIFQKLEKILATVKINTIAAPEATAEVKINPETTTTESPAQ